MLNFRKKEESTTPGADEQAGGALPDVAAQNQAAAESGQPDDGAPRMFVAPAVREALDAASAEASAHDELVETMEASVYEQVLNAPLDDTSAEEHLAAAIKGFRRAATTRYAEHLTGQATTQAEILRTLGEAEEHLRGHIALITTTKEASNG